MENKDNVKFTQSCVIRKNTSELKQELKNLGYRQTELFDDDCPWLQCNPVCWDGTVLSGQYDTLGEDYIDLDERLEDYGIDCGENETLFLALAALRDDSDYAQWFINGDVWFLCWSENHLDYIGYDDYRKATVDELVEHFNMVGDIMDVNKRNSADAVAEGEMKVSCLQPCFIRKNTPELRKKLEDLGYVDIQQHHESVIEKCGILQIYTGYYMYESDEANVFSGSVDCGVNEEEFLRLASSKRDCK